MQKYLVTVHGENLLAKVEGVQQKFGFVTNVSIEGFTQPDAEARAIELVREDNEIRDMALNTKDDPFTLSTVEAIEIETFDVDETPRTGFAFYPMES